jgi:hypothetical protein
MILQPVLSKLREATHLSSPGQDISVRQPVTRWFGVRTMERIHAFPHLLHVLGTWDYTVAMFLGAPSVVLSPTGRLRIPKRFFFAMPVRWTATSTFSPAALVHRPPLHSVRLYSLA